MSDEGDAAVLPMADDCIEGEDIPNTSSSQGSFQEAEALADNDGPNKPAENLVWKSHVAEFSKFEQSIQQGLFTRDILTSATDCVQYICDGHGKDRTKFEIITKTRLHQAIFAFVRHSPRSTTEHELGLKLLQMATTCAIVQLRNGDMSAMSTLEILFDDSAPFYQYKAARLPLSFSGTSKIFSKQNEGSPKSNADLTEFPERPRRFSCPLSVRSHDTSPSIATVLTQFGNGSGMETVFDTLLDVVQSRQSRVVEGEGASMEIGERSSHATSVDLFEHYWSACNLVANIYSHLTPKNVRQLVTEFLEVTLRVVPAISRAELELTRRQEQLGEVVDFAHRLVVEASDEAQADYVAEEVQLEVSLSLMKYSTSLEKRLSALSEVINVVASAVKREENNSRQFSTPTKASLTRSWSGNWTRKAQLKFEPLVPRDLIEWMRKRKIWRDILGPNIHAEIVRRMPPLLHFLSRYDALESDHIRLLWDAANKGLHVHRTVAKSVYQCILEISSALPSSAVVFLFSLVGEGNPRLLNEDVLALMKKIGHTAQVGDIIWDSCVKYFSRLVREGQWLERNKPSLADLAVDYLESLLDGASLSYLVEEAAKCIDALKRRAAGVPALKLLSKLIMNAGGATNVGCSAENGSTHLVMRLDQRFDLRKTLLRELLDFKSEAESLTDAAKPGIEGHFGFTYTDNIKWRLIVLKFVCDNSSLQLHWQHISDLWGALYLKPIEEDETLMMFQFLKLGLDASENIFSEPFIPESDCRLILKHLLGKIDGSPALSIQHFNTFLDFFKFCNRDIQARTNNRPLWRSSSTESVGSSDFDSDEEESDSASHALAKERVQTRIVLDESIEHADDDAPCCPSPTMVSEDKIFGLHELWQIALNVESDAVASPAIDFLISLDYDQICLPASDTHSVPVKANLKTGSAWVGKFIEKCLREVKSSRQSFLSSLQTEDSFKTGITHIDLERKMQRLLFMIYSIQTQSRLTGPRLSGEICSSLSTQASQLFKQARDAETCNNVLICLSEDMILHALEIESRDKARTPSLYDSGKVIGELKVQSIKSSDREVSSSIPTAKTDDFDANETREAEPANSTVSHAPIETFTSQSEERHVAEESVTDKASSSEEEVLELLFSLLPLSTKISVHTWKVITILPPPRKTIQRIASFEGLRDGIIGWDEFLGTTSAARLLYNSLIIHAILGLNEEEARKAEERDLCSTNASTDTKAIMDDPAPYTLKQRWVLQFLELGGLGAIWALFQKVTASRKALFKQTSTKERVYEEHVTWTALLDILHYFLRMLNTLTHRIDHHELYDISVEQLSASAEPQSGHSEDLSRSLPSFLNSETVFHFPLERPDFTLEMKKILPSAYFSLIHKHFDEPNLRIMLDIAVESLSCVQLNSQLKSPSLLGWRSHVCLKVISSIAMVNVDVLAAHLREGDLLTVEWLHSSTTTRNWWASAVTELILRHQTFDWGSTRGAIANSLFAMVASLNACLLEKQLYSANESNSPRRTLQGRKNLNPSSMDKRYENFGKHPGRVANSAEETPSAIIVQDFFVRGCIWVLTQFSPNNTAPLEYASADGVEIVFQLAARILCDVSHTRSVESLSECIGVLASSLWEGLTHTCSDDAALTGWLTLLRHICNNRSGLGEAVLRSIGNHLSPTDGNPKAETSRQSANIGTSRREIIKLLFNHLLFVSPHHMEERKSNSMRRLSREGPLIGDIGDANGAELTKLSAFLPGGARQNGSLTESLYGKSLLMLPICSRGKSRRLALLSLLALARQSEPAMSTLLSLVRETLRTIDQDSNENANESMKWRGGGKNGIGRADESLASKDLANIASRDRAAFAMDWRLRHEEQLLSLAYPETYVGLRNPGCICYMNSLLQQLFMIPHLREGILSLSAQGRGQGERGKSVLFELQSLFGKLLFSQREAIDVRNFCKSYKDELGNPVDMRIQMDANEFFCMLLDRLEAEMNPSIGVSEAAKTKNVIDEVFGGKIVNQIICRECHQVSERAETFYALSVDVKNKRNLEESLQSFVEGESLEGENAYLCENCDAKVSALKRECIQALPTMLVIHMKRFEFDYDTMTKQKINDYFEFDSALNMFAFTRDGLDSVDAGHSEGVSDNLEARTEGTSSSATMDARANVEHRDRLNMGDCFYDLVGIVVHSGSSDVGHYYSYIKERNRPVSNESHSLAREVKSRWLEFNDSSVTDFCFEQLEEECFGGICEAGRERRQNAYMLFYEKRPHLDQAQVLPRSTQKELQTKEGQNDQIDKFDLILPTSVLQEVVEDNYKFLRAAAPAEIDFGLFVNELIDSAADCWQPGESSCLSEISEWCEETNDIGLSCLAAATRYVLSIGPQVARSLSRIRSEYTDPEENERSKTNCSSRASSSPVMAAAPHYYTSSSLFQRKFSAPAMSRRLEGSEVSIETLLPMMMDKLAVSFSQHPAGCLWLLKLLSKKAKERILPLLCESTDSAVREGFASLLVDAFMTLYSHIEDQEPGTHSKTAAYGSGERPPSESEAIFFFTHALTKLFEDACEDWRFPLEYLSVLARIGSHGSRTAYMLASSWDECVIPSRYFSPEFLVRPLIGIGGWSDDFGFRRIPTSQSPYVSITPWVKRLTPLIDKASDDGTAAKFVISLFISLLRLFEKNRNDIDPGLQTATSRHERESSNDTRHVMIEKDAAVKLLGDKQIVETVVRHRLYYLAGQFIELVASGQAEVTTNIIEVIVAEFERLGQSFMKGLYEDSLQKVETTDSDENKAGGSSGQTGVSDSEHRKTAAGKRVSLYEELIAEYDSLWKLTMKFLAVDDQYCSQRVQTTLCARQGILEIAGYFHENDKCPYYSLLILRNILYMSSMTLDESFLAEAEEKSTLSNEVARLNLNCRAQHFVGRRTMKLVREVSLMFLNAEFRESITWAQDWLLRVVTLEERETNPLILALNPAWMYQQMNHLCGVSHMSLSSTDTGSESESDLEASDDEFVYSDESDDVLEGEKLDDDPATNSSSTKEVKMLPNIQNSSERPPELDNQVVHLGNFHAFCGGNVTSAKAISQSKAEKSENISPTTVGDSDPQSSPEQEAQISVSQALYREEKLLLSDKPRVPAMSPSSTKSEASSESDAEQTSASAKPGKVELPDTARHTSRSDNQLQESMNFLSRTEFPATPPRTQKEESPILDDKGPEMPTDDDSLKSPAADCPSSRLEEQPEDALFDLV